MRRTERLGSDSDLLAVGLVNGTVNLGEVVRVGDELVTGDKVLCEMIVSSRRQRRSRAFIGDGHYCAR